MKGYNCVQTKVVSILVTIFRITPYQEKDLNADNALQPTHLIVCERQGGAFATCGFGR